MKAICLALSMSVVIFLQGCSIRPLGYFEVEPFARPSDFLIEEPINLVILDDVRDSFLVEGEGIQSMKVTDFRRSVVASMENALSRNFHLINVTNVKPDSGISLVIYRLKPFWKIGSQTVQPFGSADGTYYSSTSLISAAFRFESSLFIDNKRIRDADETVYSDDQMSTADQAHPVFKNGLTKTCEVIYKELLKDEDFAVK